MKIYTIILGIMILSMSLQITQDLHIFPTVNLPQNKVDSAEGHVKEMTNSSLAMDPTSEFLGGMGFLKAIGYFFNALTSVIVIIPLLSSFQIPLTVSLPLQALIWFIYGTGVFQIITGRSLKLYD